MPKPSFALKKRLFFLTLILSAVGLAYSNIFSYDFLFDDEFLLQKNIFLRSWSTFFEIFRHSSTGGAGGIDNFYRPMQTVMYLVFSTLFGFSTETFHALNLLLHLLNTLLVWRLGEKLGFSEVSSWVAALLWGLHPLHTEAVTYMSATADPLHTAFCLLGLLVVLPDFSFRRILLALPFFVLALLSKEPAIIFPALVCVCLFFKNQQPYRINLYFKTWPLWATSMAYLILRKTYLNFDSTYTFFKISNIYTENIYYRILTFLATIPQYISLLVWPYNLHLERSFSVYIIWSLAPILGLVFCMFCLLLVIFERKRFPKFFSFAVLWVLVTYFIQSGILIPMNSFFLEHWMYLVSIAPFLVLSSTDKFAPALVHRSKFVIIYFACIAGLALYWGTYTYWQNQVWQSPLTLYRYILEVEPHPDARVYNNLAMAYTSIGQTAEALKTYEQAIARADLYPQTRHNLALLFFNKGQLDEAFIHFERALELQPDFYHSYPYLAEIYRVKGNPRKQSELLQKYNEIRKRLGF